MATDAGLLLSDVAVYAQSCLISRLQPVGVFRARRHSFNQAQAGVAKSPSGPAVWGGKGTVRDAGNA